MESPKRRFTMTLEVGADTYEDLLTAVENMVLGLRLNHADLDHNHGMISGSPVAGYVCDIRVDPAMTHERYFELVEVYRAARRDEQHDR